MGGVKSLDCQKVAYGNGVLLETCVDNTIKKTRKINDITEWQIEYRI